jgi:uncharacterized protein YabE (DUF348 family)
VVDVSARARVAPRRRAGRTRTGGAGTESVGLVDPQDDLLEWPTGPIPCVVPDPDPPTERFAAVVPEEPPVATVRPEPRPPSRRRRAVARTGVLTVLSLLVAGSATAVAADKVVTVSVDGREQVVHTFATDVGGALLSAGIVATAQDRLEPAPTTDLADGDHVILQRARPLTLVEGASERRIWTTAASVQDALRNAGVDAQPIQMSIAPATSIPLGGLAVELRVPRTVTFVDGAQDPEKITTTVGTVDALLADKRVTLGPDDVAVPSGDTPLADGMDVQVVRNGVGEVVEVRRIPPPEEVVEDPEMPRGMRKVVEKGRAGEQAVVMRVHVVNGEEARREQVRAGATTPPEKRVVRVGSGDEAPDGETLDGVVAPVVGSGVWDSLAKCEAGGNWATNSGNGYYGGLQFDRQTWMAYGGDDYAPLPHQAGRDAQIAVASKMRDERGGYGSWPACARKLGLPT